MAYINKINVEGTEYSIMTDDPNFESGQDGFFSDGGRNSIEFDSQSGTIDLNPENYTYSSQPYVTDAKYIEVNGIRVYVASSAPTGSIPTGSLGIGW